MPISVNSCIGTGPFCALSGFRTCPPQNLKGGFSPIPISPCTEMGAHLRFRCQAVVGLGLLFWQELEEDFLLGIQDAGWEGSRNIVITSDPYPRALPSNSKLGYNGCTVLFLGQVLAKVWSGESSFWPAQLYPDEAHFRFLGYCHHCWTRWIELSLVGLSGYWVCHSTYRCLVVSSTVRGIGRWAGRDR